MADLENLLLEAAGRTGASGRNNLSRQTRRRREGSYSDDDSGDDDSDSPGYRGRKPSGSQVPLKKRLDPVERDSRGGRGDNDYDDDEDGHSGNDSDSAPSVGSDLYRDEEDRENLANMTELDREMILTERSIKRDDYQLKKKARASSSKSDKKSRKETPPLSRSGRSSTITDKSAAKDDALNEILSKRLRQHDSDGYRRPRDSGGGIDGAVGGNRDSSPPKRKAHPVASSPSSDSSLSESEGRGAGRREGVSSAKQMVDSDDDNSGSDTEPLTFDDIKQITIRRSKLAKWFMEPFFEELIVGCFVRVGIGRTRSGVSLYRLCFVLNVDASDPDRLYKFENRSTYKYLNCAWGSESSAARLQVLLKEIERSNGRMPSRQDILKKREAIQKINNFVYSAATVKQMLMEKKSASSRPLNVAAEKDRLRKEMEVAQSRGDEAEIERIKDRLKGLQDMSRQGKDAKAVRLAEMNKKNREENFKNASELKPVNTSLKAGEAGYDPFSRRWTRSTNYYASKPGAEGDETTANGPTEISSVRHGVPLVKAGEVATAAALEAAAGAGKLVDTAAPTDQGTESNLLHNFELPISLSGLQKKQRIEATIGFKLPENDGRRHSLTLTVSDYKRRRGLL
ncbi:unnamed protein product [Spirodela intermedia]|uniref:Plus3 domain-containing protein n=1 Tax=Spirodela intermedia TaxID=51605 RepID=A0A7I8JNJ6_SPIIN|nr:unnamed protein product [Spirodela intermedia]CAA6671719.1 unnamed protein product [Spirodela intermedia]